MTRILARKILILVTYESLSCSLEDNLNISDELNKAIKAYFPRRAIQCERL